MASLDLALDEFELVLSRLQSNLKAGINNRAKLVLESRRTIAEQIPKILRLVSHDEKFQKHSDLATEFTENLRSVRQKMAALQTKWRSVAISDNFEGYAHEAIVLLNEYKDFLRWARAVRARI